MPGLGARAWAFVLLLAAAGLGARVAADPVPTCPPVGAPVLTAHSAIAWALQTSPELAVARKQRGIAAANVVIARTYPFNPIWQNFTLPNGGPAGAGITNRVFVENTFRLDLELRGQGKIRKEVAAAAVSRTDWEIATQELAVAVRAIRGFNTFVYRQEKLQLLEDTIKLQEQTVQKAKRLAEQGKLKPADVMLANSDLIEARAQRGPALALQVAAWNELRRVWGVDKEVAAFDGRLSPTAPADDVAELTRMALQMRPDLKALQMAGIEADQRVRLEIANRYGNPSIGPAMEYNETRVTFVGAWMVYALPVLNTRRGDIMLREAERDRVTADQRRIEIQAGIDVRAALARMREAQKWVNYFGAESLPALQGAMEAFEKLFALGEPSVDVLRLIDARRRLLRARDSYLDALWELSQARADLAAATGDLGAALDPAPCAAPEVLPAQAVVPAATPRPLLLPPVPRTD
jgi:outer membrane protein TolC